MSAPKVVRTWTFDVLKGRCVEEGDCLIWQGSVQSGGHPCACIERNQVLVRRWVFTRLMGKALPRGAIVDSRCSNPLCVSPKCLFRSTRQARIRRAYVELMADPQNARKRLQFAINNGLAKLDMSRAEAIRASPLTNQEAAKEWGVSDTSIRMIRQGKSWKPPKVANSVFSLAQTL